MMKRKEVLLLLGSGLLCAFGQPAWVVWLAPLVAVCGFALFWYSIDRITHTKNRFWMGAGWFTLVQLVQLSWMTSRDYQGIYILFVYVGLSLALGCQFGLLTAFVKKIPLVATAAVWVLMEWARLFVLCGFSWNPVGLTLTAVPFTLQMASLFGVLGLSFWVMLTNLAVWKRRWEVAVGLALFPYCFGAVQWYRHSDCLISAPHMGVALVQTALLPSQKQRLQNRHHEFISPYEQWSRIVHLLADAAPLVDLIVLPEAAVPLTDTYPFYKATTAFHTVRSAFGWAPPVEHERVSNRYWVEALGKVFDADVVMGVDTEEESSYFASALFYSAKRNEMHKYDKQILLPLAEYLPFQSLHALTALYGVTDFFTHGHTPALFDSKVPLAASICYEETFGSVLRESRKQGAALFVNVSNDNWFPFSRLPKQHFDLARVHAVASGTPLIRACNAGVTAALDAMGGVIGELKEWNAPGILVAQVPLYQIPTLYTVWGDWGVVSVSILLLAVCWVINSSVFSRLRQ